MPRSSSRPGCDPHPASLSRLSCCSIRSEGCVALALALRSNPSHLSELNLGGNKLGDLEGKLLADFLEEPHCQLIKLRLSFCSIKEEDCVALASALRLNPSHLRELNLGGNTLGDSGVETLSNFLKNPHCKVATLQLPYCSIRKEGCAALASALRSNPSHLRELNLDGNKLGDLGVKLLSDVLQDTQCKLETLQMSFCSIGNKGCVALASALRSNPSHIRELNLVGNTPGYSAMSQLDKLVNDRYFKLILHDESQTMN